MQTSTRFDFVVQNFYNYSPIFIQNILLNVKSLQIECYRYSKSFKDILNQFNSWTYIDRAELEAIKFKKLQLLFSAIQKNNFYKGYDLNNFSDLPIISKEKVKNRINDLSQNVAEKMRMTHTSGTSGSGLIFPFTRTAEQTQWAVWWRYRNWHRITHDLKCGFFGGRRIVPATQKGPPYWRVSKPSKQILFSSYNLNVRTVQHYLDCIKKNEIIWLHGYPSVISNFASLIIESKLQPQISVKYITTGAENLMKHQVDLINLAFGVKPLQHYGQAEGVANISECPQGRLHVDEDYSIVEFLPTDRPNIYRIIGTNLNNFAFPLIRYDTADLVEINNEHHCDCGRPGRIVNRIDGRDEDYILMQDGTKIGRLDHLFKDLINIRESQIVQYERGNIEINIVKGANYTLQDEFHLKKQIREFLGGINYQINYSDLIPKTPSGKLKFVISKLDKL